VEVGRVAVPKRQSCKEAPIVGIRREAFVPDVREERSLRDHSEFCRRFQLS
jgi:hypothetical protein